MYDKTGRALTGWSIGKCFDFCVNTTHHLESLMTVQEVAALLVVSPSTVYAWRHRRVGPPGIRVGQQVRYRRRDVEAWLDSQAETPSGAA